MSTRKSRASTDTEVTEDDPDGPVNTDDHDALVNTEAEKLRDNNSCLDVFAEVITDMDNANEPAKKTPRLSSFDMFGPDSPPEPPANILTPLFDVSTNCSAVEPKTVRLQVLSIVGVDKFGFIGEL